MKNVKYLLFISVIAMVLSYSSASFAEHDVQRWLKSGDIIWDTKEQNVIDEDAYSITYQGLGKQPRADIIFIVYKTNSYFTRGETAFENQEWRQAIEFYKKALEGGKEKWIKSYCLLRIGQCYWYMGGNNRKSAITYLNRLIKEVPTGPFFAQGCCILCEIYTFEKSYDKAAKSIKAVNDNRKLQTCWREEAQVLTGFLYLAQRDFRKATSHFKSISSRLTYTTQKQKAQFGLGQCLEAEGQEKRDPAKYKDALKVYEGIANAYVYSTLGKAWAAMSRCYYNLKDFENSYKYGLKAGLMYIEVDPNLSAMGLYFAGKAFLVLYNAAEKNSDRRAFFGSNIKLIRRLFETKLFGRVYATKGLDELK